MKKIILTVSIALASFSAAFAGNDILVRDAITKQMQSPYNLKSHFFNEAVNVQFKIDSNGKASIINLNTADPELKKYIAKHFNKIDFSALIENTETIYNICINFKVI